MRGRNYDTRFSLIQEHFRWDMLMHIHIDEEKLLWGEIGQ